MDLHLQERKQRILASLEQIRIRLQQLRAELEAREDQEQQALGALMLIDELMVEAATPAVEAATPAVEPIAEGE
jgi:hypothetical protein